MEPTEIKDKLRSFICHEILQKPDYPLADDESLINGGLVDSFAFVNIALFLEETFDVMIPDADLTVENMDTVDTITAYILEQVHSGMM